MTIGKLTQIVLECADTRREAQFWQRILDLPDPSGDDDWLTLDWPAVGRLAFNRVPDYSAPTWPGVRGSQQMHFDLLVADLSVAGERVEQAGGAPLSEVIDPGPTQWRIYADPEGHPFCLVTAPV